MSLACEQDIINGFESDALGGVYTYQSDRDDQLNLIGMVAAGTDDYFKCSIGISKEVWNYELHTATQLKQVLNDGKIIKLQKLQAFATKKTAVNNSTTVEDIELVEW